MCWNAEVSLLTFLSSFIGCCYLWYRNSINDRTLALWIFTFSLMQFFEFLMWIDIDGKKGLNNLATKLSLGFILLQPVVLGLGLLKYGKIINNKLIRIIIYILIAILSVKIIYAFIYAFIDKKQWLSIKGENCHLIWYFINHSTPTITHIDSIYFGSLLVLTLMIHPFNMGLLYSIFGVLSLFVNRLYYGLEVGSMWCWISNILVFIAIFSKYII